MGKPLYVIKFKRPSSRLERKQTSLDKIWDCAAFFYLPFAKDFLAKQADAEDATIVKVDEDEYSDIFLNKPDVELNFYKTGELPLEELNEEIDIGYTQHKISVSIEVGVEAPDGVSTDYSAEIDSKTRQIVVSPVNPKVFFTDNTDGDTVTVDLEAVMMTSGKNTSYSYEIDRIGQLVIIANNHDAYFETVALEKDLNIIGEKSFDKFECLTRVRKITEGYTKTGCISTEFKEELDYSREILSHNYHDVEVESFGDKMLISYERPKRKFVENEIIGDDEGSMWEVGFADTDLTEDAEGDDSSTGESELTVNVKAKSADDAIKYAQQHARVEQTKDDKWNDMKVVAVVKK